MTPSYLVYGDKNSVMLVMVGDIEIGVCFGDRMVHLVLKILLVSSWWANGNTQWIIQNVSLCSRGHG